MKTRSNKQTISKRTFSPFLFTFINLSESAEDLRWPWRALEGTTDSSFRSVATAFVCKRRRQRRLRRVVLSASNPSLYRLGWFSRSLFLSQTLYRKDDSHLLQQWEWFERDDRRTGRSSSQTETTHSALPHRTEGYFEWLRCGMWLRSIHNHPLHDPSHHTQHSPPLSRRSARNPHSKLRPALLASESFALETTLNRTALLSQDWAAETFRLFLKQTKESNRARRLLPDHMAWAQRRPPDGRATFDSRPMRKCR